MDFQNIRSATTNDSCCPDLSLNTRIIGFSICVLVSIVFGFLACAYIGGLFTGSVNTFVILFSISTAFSIASSFFFKGPKQQWKVITDPKRLVASIVFVIAFIMTFIAVYVFKSSALVIVFVVIEICAALFYLLTFVPYGTAMCKKCCRTVFCCEGESETSGNLL